MCCATARAGHIPPSLPSKAAIVQQKLFQEDNLRCSIRCSAASLIVSDVVGRGLWSATPAPWGATRAWAVRVSCPFYCGHRGREGNKALASIAFADFVIRFQYYRGNSTVLCKRARSNPAQCHGVVTAVFVCLARHRAGPVWLLQDRSGIRLVTVADPTRYQPHFAGRMLL